MEKAVLFLVGSAPTSFCSIMIYHSQPHAGRCAIHFACLKFYGCDQAAERLLPRQEKLRYSASIGDYSSNLPQAPPTSLKFSGRLSSSPHQYILNNASAGPCCHLLSNTGTTAAAPLHGSAHTLGFCGEMAVYSNGNPYGSYR